MFVKAKAPEVPAILGAGDWFRPAGLDVRVVLFIFKGVFVKKTE
jgi:hypothetical protein